MACTGPLLATAPVAMFGYLVRKNADCGHECAAMVHSIARVPPRMTRQK